ncbi:hypothetical protein [Dasania marina]|uniref:hypothetical protein n=1 Tax=Dasania marina TaxID=471499 RepID=UPI0012E9E953|nr:hypothetical protein [Dasania marina]
MNSKFLCLIVAALISNGVLSNETKVCVDNLEKKYGNETGEQFIKSLESESFGCDVSSEEFKMYKIFGLIKSGNVSDARKYFDKLDLIKSDSPHEVKVLYHYMNLELKYVDAVNNHKYTKDIWGDIKK